MILFAVFVRWWVWFGMVVANAKLLQRWEEPDKTEVSATQRRVAGGSSYSEEYYLTIHLLFTGHDRCTFC